NAFPEIEGFTRLVPFSGHFMRYGDNQFKENSVALADSGFFEIFPIPFIAGDGASALSQPNSIVITRELATKYFGNGDPLGKQLNYSVFSKDLNVTGVIESFPANAHFHFDAFISRNTIPNLTDSSWVNTGTFTYLRLFKHADAKALQS